MAEVFRAHDELLSRDVAVKVFRSQPLTPDPAGGPERQQTELHALAQLNHPNLITLYDGSIGDPASPPYLVMELVDGPSLAARLTMGPLPEPEARAIGTQVADALAYVHALGMVHRDVKPANILVGSDPTTGDVTVRARLSDFGIVRLLGSEHVTGVHLTVGTASYLSPEQARGSDVGPAADIYSLGLVLLEALTGVRCFDGPPLEAMAARLSRGPDIPDGLPEPWPGLVAAMTAADPAQRPSAAQVATTLRAASPAADAAVAAVPFNDVPFAAAPYNDVPLASALPVDPPLAAAPPVDEPLAAPVVAAPLAAAPLAAGAFGEAPLDDGLTDPSAAADAETSALRATAAPRRRARWPWLVAAVIVLCLLGVGGVLLLNGSSGDPTPAGTDPGHPRAGLGTGTGSTASGHSRRNVVVNGSLPGSPPTEGSGTAPASADARQGASGKPSDSRSTTGAPPARHSSHTATPTHTRSTSAAPSSPPSTSTTPSSAPPPTPPTTAPSTDTPPSAGASGASAAAAVG